MNKISFPGLLVAIVSVLSFPSAAFAEDQGCFFARMFADSNFRTADEEYSRQLAAIDKQLNDSRGTLTQRYKALYPAWNTLAGKFFQTLKATDGSDDPRITDRAVVNAYLMGAVAIEPYLGYFKDRAKLVDKTFPESGRVHMLEKLTSAQLPQFEICVDSGNFTGCSVVTHDSASTASEAAFIQEQFANERRSRMINAGMKLERPKREDFADASCPAEQLPAAASATSQVKNPVVVWNAGEDAVLNYSIHTVTPAKP